MCRIEQPFVLVILTALSVSLMAVGLAQAQTSPVVINELMATNSDCIADGQGEFDDWVELHNRGPAPIDVGGMYLTDDPADPTRWQIPIHVPQLTLIAPDGYLVIWLDGDIGDAGLHASFQLDADGDGLALFAADGATPMDSVSFEQQRCDVSYGRAPNGSGAWSYLVAATPQASNSDDYEGIVADTKFDHDRGFYEAPFQVTITCDTPGVTIVYTLDGRPPYDPTYRYPAGTTYTGPIPISKTTCLRACALKAGWLASNVDTHTYLFLDEVLSKRQSQVVAAGYPNAWSGSYPADYEMDPEIVNDPAYASQMRAAMLAIPTLSLVTDKGNLFNRTNDPVTGGIYIYTGHGSTGGQDWERPVSAELFNADGSREFQIDCGIRLQGGESRNPPKCPKHSFSLRFRSKYGANRLDFDLFEGSPVTSFETVQLRGFFNNAWTHWAPDQRERTQYIRDQWIHDCLLDMGQADGGGGLYVHLYLNGLYWGLYCLQERPVASHYVAYHGGDADRIDAINGGRATDGTIQAWQEARSIAASRDWNRILETLDIDSFIDWTLLNLFAGNVDLKTDGNWRAAGGGPDRRPWHFYAWDAEHVLENRQETGNRPSSDPTGMFQPLSQLEEFRVRFGDRVHKHLFNGGALTTDWNIERWLRRSDEIHLAVIAESARWGDYRRDVHPYSSGPYYLYTRNDYWLWEKQRLLDDYFPRRNAVALQMFKSMGLYPNVEAPAFHVDGVLRHGGQMRADDRLTMPAVAGVIWYTLDGTDPRTPAATGSINETELIAEDAPKRVLVPTGPVGDAWRGGTDFDDSAWIAGAGGVGYERSTGYEQFFSIDVQNRMYARNTSCYIRIPFDLSAEDVMGAGASLLKVRYDDGFVAYLNGVEIQRVQFSGTPTWDSSAGATHSDIDAINFETFDISRYIGHLRMGRNILAIHGLNESTTSSDFLISVKLVTSKGTGNTPSGVSPTAQQYVGPVTLDRSAHVKARALSGSTWSALNEATFSVGLVVESLCISEIMYHPIELGRPDDPNAEFIELTNVGTETINLNLVRFTNGVDFTFPSLDLAPGAYVVVVRDTAAFQTRYGPDVTIAGQYSGSLSNGGERIELRDAAGEVIHNFRFEDDWYDLTDGLGFSLIVTDPAGTRPDAYGDRSTWHPSAAPGGSPGFAD
ncbi:MAG: lamin tail domain-containing protein [Sedimentisphaerales bacterium]|nr:lamin tail domain-containing protein [Sedimentisphaerales bacterium]